MENVLTSGSLVEPVRIRKEVEKSTISITRVYEAPYQKPGTLSAEVKQTIETTSFYPTKSVSNNMQDNIFAVEDFGITETPYKAVENRVAWIPVPIGTTSETVALQLAKFPQATIYKVMDSKPILTSDQVRAISGGLTTLAIIANRQVARYPANADANIAGKLIVDANGKPQYRSVFFSRVAKEDVDNRVKDLKTAKPEDFYTTAEIEAELQAIEQTVL